MSRKLIEDLMAMDPKRESVSIHAAVSALQCGAPELPVLLCLIRSLNESNQRLVALAIEAKQNNPPYMMVKSND